MPSVLPKFLAGRTGARRVERGIAGYLTVMLSTTSVTPAQFFASVLARDF